MDQSDPATPHQLALALGHRVSFDHEDFLSGPGNAAALALVESWPDWPGRTVALVGPEGAGKSHLAAMWAKTTGAKVVPIDALDAATVPAALSRGALVIEEAGRGRLDEPALFHLLNLAQEERAFVLITGRSVPTSWSVVLPDLASRLRALPVVTLAAPDDAQLRAVLVKLFADRQLTVDDSLIGFLMDRIERSFAAARTVVAVLDQEALRRQRPVTRALATEILRDNPL